MVKHLLSKFQYFVWVLIYLSLLPRILDICSFLNWAVVLLLPSWLQPGDLMKYFNAVIKDPDEYAFLNRSPQVLKATTAGLKDSIFFVNPYLGLSSSGWKLPNNLSQIINTPAWFLSRYLRSTPWCTRWWEGVLNMNSIGFGSLWMVSVCIQNW